MTKAVAVALVLLTAGCGSSPARGHDGDAAGRVRLAAICPAAHQVYDALVASDPASQEAFLDHLASLRAAGDVEARDALGPVVTAARALVAAGRGPQLDQAQEGVYRSIVGLDRVCRSAGSYILH